MKIGNVVIALAGVLTTALLAPTVVGTYQDYASWKAQLAEAEHTELKVTEQLKQNKQTVESGDRAFLLDNVAIAERCVNLNGGNLTKIVAQSVVDGELTSIVEVAEPADTMYFTESVDFMEFDYNVTDALAFTDAVRASEMVWDYVSIDFSSGTAILRVAAADNLNGSYTEEGAVIPSVPEVPESSEESVEQPTDTTLGGEIEENPAAEFGAVSGETVPDTEEGGDVQ